MYSWFVFLWGMTLRSVEVINGNYLGKQTYGYEPGLEKKGLVYLIIEPDSSQPWRQKGWLETVVQGGEAVWTKRILNGFILEKRVYPL